MKVVTKLFAPAYDSGIQSSVRARAISLGVPPDFVDVSVANGWGTQASYGY